MPQTSSARAQLVSVENVDTVDSDIGGEPADQPDLKQDICIEDLSPSTVVDGQYSQCWA